MSSTSTPSQAFAKFLETASSAGAHPREAAVFFCKLGRFPIQQKVGRYSMREILLLSGEVRFAVGCQQWSFKYWARHFDDIADTYRATQHERETARALINLARVRAGKKPMRSKR